MMLLTTDDDDDDAHYTHRKAYCYITQHSTQTSSEQIMDYSDDDMAGGVNNELKSDCKDRTNGLSVVQGVCT